jgi:hypothetical protein
VFCASFLAGRAGRSKRLTISAGSLMIVVTGYPITAGPDGAKSALIVRIPVPDCYRFAQGVSAPAQTPAFAAA